MKRFSTILVFVFAFFLLLPVRAMADGLSIIRDTEIETSLRAWCAPIWRAAGLNPDAVDLILVNSPEVNAFVAGGSNIFVYTGLITATKNPGELLGVIAHETGHIAGGHLIQGRMAMQRASYESMLAAILGIGAAASGNSEAGQAVIMGGQSMAISSFLAHSRVQEASADQAALSYLEHAGDSPKGLASFLESLKGQELLPESQQNPYMRTHPLTSDRMDAMEQGVARSAIADKPYPADMVEKYTRIKAKLVGFISPQQVGWLYSEKDTSVPALYARAIAAYQTHDKTKALDLIDRLLAKEPKNPWFLELKGQMLRDFGQLAHAADAYRRALTYAPDAALIRIDLAQVLIEMPGADAARYTEAEKNLDLAQPHEQKSPDIQRLYATLYGRMGDEPRARYHLAEEATLNGNTEEARRLLDGALPKLAPGSRAARQANDLKVYLDAQPKKDDRRER